MIKTNKLINFNQNYHYFSIFIKTIKYHQNNGKTIKSIENIISFIFIKQLIFHI